MRRMVEDVICDGCHRSTLEHPDMRIIESVSVRIGRRTVDICLDCYEADKYICKLCHRVHDDDHPCQQMIDEYESILIDEYERILREEEG